MRRLLVALACLLVLGLSPTSAAADTTPSLPAGDWWLLANGYEGTLHISSVDTYGNLSGTVFGKPISGFWDGFAGKISFEISDPPSLDLQVYTGFLDEHDSMEWHYRGMHGYFQAFSGTGAKATRSVYPWRASLATTAPPQTVESSNYRDGLLGNTDWTVYANGVTGKLVLNGIDPQGNFSGMLFGDAVQGFWNGHQKRITFIRFGSLSDTSKLQVYTGYLLADGCWFAVCGLGDKFAGSFEAFSGSGGSAQRSVFGWYAAFEKAR
jgi:hypothetical protein